LSPFDHVCSALPHPRLRSVGWWILGPSFWSSANIGEYDVSGLVFARGPYQISEFSNNSAEFCHDDNVRDSADACARSLQSGLADAQTIRSAKNLSRMSLGDTAHWHQSREYRVAFRTPRRDPILDYKESTRFSVQPPHRVGFHQPGTIPNSR
jgi:hypothetical protein